MAISRRRVMILAVILSILGMFILPRQRTELDAPSRPIVALPVVEAATIGEARAHEPARDDGTSLKRIPAPSGLPGLTFDVFLPDGAPAGGVPVLALDAGARFVPVGSSATLGATGESGRLMVSELPDGLRAKSLTYAATYRSLSWPFQRVGVDHFLCRLSEPFVVSIRCETTTGEALSGVSVYASLGDIPFTPHDPGLTPGIVRSQERVFAGVSSEDGSVDVVVPRGGHYLTSLFKRGYVAIHGLDWPLDRIEAGSPTRKVVFGKVFASTWEAPADEVVSYRLDARGHYWDEAVVRRLRAQEALFGLAADHSYVVVAAGRDKPQVAGSFFLRYSGKVKQDLALFEIDEAVRMTRVVGSRGDDKTGVVVVRVVDDFDNSLDGVPVILGTPRSDAMKHCRSGEATRLPSGSYACSLSTTFMAEVIRDRGGSAVEIAPSKEIEFRLRVRGKWAPARFDLVRRDGTRPPEGRYEVKCVAEVAGADPKRRTGVILTGDGWQSTRAWLPAGMVRISGCIAGSMLDDASVNVVAGADSETSITLRVKEQEDG